MQKRVNIIAAILIMLCLGSVYAWSIFVPELKQEYGLSTSQTQIIFGTIIAVFTITMIWAGKINRNYGPHVVGTLSGILFALGYTLSFFSNGNFIVLWIGIGILGGMGTGLGYLVSLTVPVKWVPEKKGLITGFITAGFGGGAILLSYLAKFLLSNGFDVLTIFLLIGLLYGTIIIISAQNLSEPKGYEASVIIKAEFLRDLNFARLFIAIFGGTFVGLLVIGNLTPIGLLQNIDKANLVLAIAVFSVANFTGRLFWGWLSDFIKGDILIPVSILMLGFSTYLIGYLQLTPNVFLLLSFLIGFGFGANFVLFAKETAQIYGIKNMEIVYPYLFLGYGTAGVFGPAIGGWIFDKSGSYLMSVQVALVVSITVVVLYFVLNSLKKYINENKKNRNFYFH